MTIFYDLRTTGYPAYFRLCFSPAVWNRPFHPTINRTAVDLNFRPWSENSKVHSCFKIELAFRCKAADLFCMNQCTPALSPFFSRGGAAQQQGIVRQGAVFYFQR